MSETCECGCGATIGPADNDQFFKRQPCQKLWLASLSQPEQAQSGWRAQQRHLTELWLCVLWGDAQDYYEVDYPMIVGIANGMLSDLEADMVRFTEDQSIDALLVVAHRHELLSGGGWARLWDQVPLWAKIQQAKYPAQISSRQRHHSGTLASSYQTPQPAQGYAADLVGPTWPW